MKSNWWSLTFKVFVNIIKVRQDVDGELIIDAWVPFPEGEKMIMFRRYELEERLNENE